MSLPASVTNKIKERNQSVKWAATLDIVFVVKGYCCNIDSDTIMGVSKEPVVVLSLSPNTICLGDSMAWNFAGSYAPGSSITSRSINFGDGNEDNPAGASGTHTYASDGNYTVTATVTEGTGLSSTVEFEVNVIDCDGDSETAAFFYAIVYGEGVFLGEWS